MAGGFCVAGFLRTGRGLRAVVGGLAPLPIGHQEVGGGGHQDVEGECAEAWGAQQGEEC